MLYALLFLPALLAIAYVFRPRPTILEEAVVAAPEPATKENPFEALDTLLGELERLTLDERDVDELERLADELERTARELERVG